MARKGENIYKRKDGRLEGRYISSYDNAGKAKYSYVYAKTYSEVKQKLSSVKVGSIISNSEKSKKTLAKKAEKEKEPVCEAPPVK